MNTKRLILSLLFPKSGYNFGNKLISHPVQLVANLSTSANRPPEKTQQLILSTFRLTYITDEAVFCQHVSKFLFKAHRLLCWGLNMLYLLPYICCFYFSVFLKVTYSNSFICPVWVSVMFSVV